MIGTELDIIIGTCLYDLIGAACFAKEDCGKICTIFYNDKDLEAIGTILIGCWRGGGCWTDCWIWGCIGWCILCWTCWICCWIGWTGWTGWTDWICCWSDLKANKELILGDIDL